MCVCIHVKYRCCRHIFGNLEFSRQIFEKYSNIKFCENPCCGSRVVPCGQTDRQTDMTKQIVAFRHFANAPNSGQFGKMKQMEKTAVGVVVVVATQ